jgi:hypothetical protein
MEGHIAHPGQVEHKDGLVFKGLHKAQWHRPAQQ